MSAGVELPKGWAVGGWLLSGGEKMSKSTGNVVKPLDLVDTVGVDGFRYYVLADTPYGQDGDFTYEGLVGRYNADLANNLGNLVARVATVVDVEVRRHRAGAVGRQPARRRRRRRRRRRDRGVGRRRSRAAPSRPRGSWCGRRTPTSRPTSRGSSSPVRRSTPCSATPSRRCGSSPSSPSPAIPATAQAIWERIGLPGSVLDQRVPGRRRVGRLPGRPARSPRAPPLFPRITVVTRAGRAGWLDSHCHLPGGRRGRRSSPRPAAAGVDDDGHGRVRPGVVARGARRRRAVPRRPRHGRAAPARGAPRRRHDPRPVRRPGAPGRGRRVRPRLPLRPLAPRRPAGRRSPPRSRWPTSSACRS